LLTKAPAQLSAELPAEEEPLPVPAGA